MSEMILWWAGVEGLGIICLPLAAVALARLPDRGWFLAKPLGLLLWCYLIWLPLVVAPALPYSRDFVVFVLAVFVLINVVLLPRVARPIWQVLRRQLGYVLIGEGVFAGACALLAWVRAFTPDIAGTEKFMDAAFVSAIWRAPHLPPPDPWLSGYVINYYYFGHFMIATLAKLLGTMPAVAFNTGVCIIFGLTAVGVYSVTCNAIAAGWGARQRLIARAPDLAVTMRTPVGVLAGGELVRTDSTMLDRMNGVAFANPPLEPDHRLLRTAPLGIFAVALVLLLGNLAGAQQWLLHRADWANYNWWDPSRVIPNTINEFPAFSFLLADLHAHVLALPFTVLAIGLALCVLLGRGRGWRVFGEGLMAPIAGLIAAVSIGALYAINGWDLPTYLGIVGICVALQQWVAHDRRWSAVMVRDVALVGITLALLCIVLYLPFYLEFSSPAQGIGVVTAAGRSALGDLALIFGTQALLALGLLMMLTVRAAPVWRARVSRLWSGSWGTKSGRMALVLWGIALVVVVGEGSALLVAHANAAVLLVTAGTMLLCVLLLGTARRMGPDALFAVVLIGVAGALVALCEVIYLRDVFAGSLPRMNTVFKFYFQAWTLSGIAGACALGIVMASARVIATDSMSHARRIVGGSLRMVWGLGVLMLLIAGAVYPILGTYSRTGHLQQLQGLDGSRYLETTDPGDYGAITWLNQHVQGEAIIVEASGGEYTSFARVSTFTGLPTIMGWSGHEFQWRVNWLRDPAHNIDFARRLTDLDTIYTSTDQQAVMALLHRYHAKYLYVGALERQKYPNAPLDRFQQFLPVVYRDAGVTIYGVP